MYLCSLIICRGGVIFSSVVFIVSTIIGAAFGSNGRLKPVSHRSPTSAEGCQMEHAFIFRDEGGREGGRVLVSYFIFSFLMQLAFLREEKDKWGYSKDFSLTFICTSFLLTQ